MLGKNKNIVENEKVPISSPVVGENKTIIGRHIAIEGCIQGKEDLLIEGSVKGKVELEQHHLAVGPQGKVEAEIQAENVTVSGTLIGNIKASGKVKLTQDANFSGEIKARSISVEDGAYLKAMIELEKEPQAKGVPAVKLAHQSESASGKGSLSLAGDSESGK